MNLKERLFPVHPRFFVGQRWLNIALRSLHLLGVAGMGAGFLVPGVEAGAWRPYALLTFVTGFGLSLIYVWTDGRWLLQLCGQTVVLKLLLLALMVLWPAAGPALFAVIIFISGFSAHAPARVRHFSIFRRKALEHPRHRSSDLS